MAERRPSSKAVIVVTLAVVVASFVSGSIYGEVRASRTHDLTAEIAGNESPSIMHLAAARAELRDLQRLLSTHVLLASTGGKTDIAPIKQARERLRSSLAAYFALPYLPGERNLAQAIERELIDVDVLAGRILEETRAGRYPVAEKLLVDELPPASDKEADAIMAAIQLNAKRVQAVAVAIEGERQRRLVWIFGLDGISAALAVALAVLALRTVTSKEEVMSRRSEELEGFAGRVAHDLLNPIAAVELSLAAAARTEGPRRETSLARAGGSLRRARRLIDDLLAFAQAGARPTPGMSASVDEVLMGVAEEMRAPALQHEVTLEVELPKRPVAVRCATGVLSSLLSNLVSNAIKHMSDRPRRQVRVGVIPLGDRVRFEVSDTGPGLPAELLRRAFDPYVRAVGTQAPGLGLGLATVRRLVEGHDGRYGVRSAPGVGSLFWFELPAAPVVAAPANDVHPPTAPAPSAPDRPHVGH
jgi:signal transduction histidine kinase